MNRYFIDLEKLIVKDKFPGATASYFQTEHSTIAYTEIKEGVEIPLHHHVNEAVDILMEGILEMRIGDTVDRLVPGKMSYVPSNIMHSAKAITDCKVLTVLYPQREL